ncbi:MAG: hypothetical protein IKP96_01890 [Elusimicrobiaceae bacterium]|nr:hypothetical protein [Elusimicrobiaceae bacterium]
MLKILIKAAILVFIILSIYFIVNPAACSNFIMGRVTRGPESQPATETLPGDHRELFVPAGDQPLQEEPKSPVSVQTTETKTTEPQTTDPVPGVTDTNSLKERQEPSQEDIDYAIASRYVELENEYAREKKMGKDTAKEISYIVMDDFELTPQEWEEFLERATASNLFNEIRTEMAKNK